MALPTVYKEKPGTVPVDEGLDTKALILERKKDACDDKHRKKVWALRLVASNVLDITSSGSYSAPRATEGQYQDLENVDIEEARHNPVAANTDIQAQSLTFSAPDVNWKFVPAGTSMTRRAWYLRRYHEQHHAEMFQWFLLDGIIGGGGNIVGGVRGGMPFLEWADDLDVQWDPKFKEQHRRRYVYFTKRLPTSEAVAAYPPLGKLLNWQPGKANGEKEVEVVCYWSPKTRAVLYKSDFILEPEPNPYKRIPMIRWRLFQKPSMKHATGSVENQLGTLQIILRLQRAIREIALKAGSQVGVASGFPQGDVDRILSGEETVILQGGENSKFSWAEAGDSTHLMAPYDKFEQNLAAESGVDPFMLSQTDVKVDFASQLSFMAGKSGVRGKHTAQRFEEGVKDAINLLMDIGALFAPPETLYVQNTEIDYAAMGMVADGKNALQSLLGSNGEMIFKPGGMAYRSPAEKLNEVMVFGQVLTTAMSLAPALQPQFIKMAADAFEVDNPDDWGAAMEQAILEQKMMQEQQAMMAQTAESQQTAGPRQSSNQGAANGSRPASAPAPAKSANRMA